jgi:hypothetical protein
MSRLSLAVLNNKNESVTKKKAKLKAANKILVCRGLPFKPDVAMERSIQPLSKDLFHHPSYPIRKAIDCPMGLRDTSHPSLKELSSYNISVFFSCFSLF